MRTRVVRRTGLGDMAAITSPAQLADSNGNVLAYDQQAQRFVMVRASQAKLAGCTSLGTNMGLWSIDPACGCVGQAFLTTNPATVPSNVDPRLAPCSFTPGIVTPAGTYQPIPGAPNVTAQPVQTIPGAGPAPVGSMASTAAASTGSVQSSDSFLDSAMAWVSANPLLAAGAAAAVLFLVVKR